MFGLFLSKVSKYNININRLLKMKRFWSSNKIFKEFLYKFKSEVIEYLIRYVIFKYDVIIIKSHLLFIKKPWRKQYCQNTCAHHTVNKQLFLHSPINMTALISGFEPNILTSMWKGHAVFWSNPQPAWTLIIIEPPLHTLK